MTVPNGADGINTTDGFLMVSAYSHGDLSAADLVGNDEDTVRAMYTDRYINGGNSVFTDSGGPLALVWEGLRQGISLPLSIIEAIVKRLFGIDINFDFIDDALDSILEVPVLGDIVEAITGILGGDLGDLTTFFQDIPLIGDLVEAITGILGGDLGDLTSFFEDIPLIGDIVAAITGGAGPLSDITDFFGELFGIFGGATDLGGIGTFITNLLGAFGGAGSAGAVGTFITNLLGAFGGATGTAGVGSFITNLLGAFGGATGVAGVGTFITNLLGAFGGATGTAGVGSFITSLLGVFGGATGVAGVGTFITNLLGAFGGATGTAGVGTFITNLLGAFGGATGTAGVGTFITSLLGAFGGATTVGGVISFLDDVPLIGDLVEAITGGAGPLGDLTDFFGGLVPLDELVEALTGSVGDLTDIVAFVNEIPLLGDLVSAITGGGGGLGGLTAWATSLVGFDIFDELLSGLGGGFGDTISDIIDRLDDFLTPSSDIPGGNIVGEILDGIVPGIGGILDGIFGALTGHTGTGTSHAQASSALAAQNAALVGAQAALARLEGVFTGGVTAEDLFEFSDSDDAGANWSLTYSGSSSGHVFVDGHNAAWQAAALTANTRTVRARWLGTNATSSTDYQHVEVILNSVPQEPVLGFGSSAANDILLRMDAGGTNFIRIRFRGDNVCIISRIVSGTETVMDTQSLPSPLSSSSRIGGEAGKAGTARYFRPLFNGFPLTGYTESGSASLVGASYRGWGWGMFAGAKTDLIIIPAQTKPGSMKQWTASDLVMAA